MPITPAEFVRRLYTQLEKGKGMRFSPEEMDMLAEMGAIDAVSKFAADWVRQQSEERLALSRGKAGAGEERYGRPRPERHHELTADEAALRALEMCLPKGGRKGVITPQDVEDARRRARSRTKPSGRGL